MGTENEGTFIDQNAHRVWHLEHGWGSGEHILEDLNMVKVKHSTQVKISAIEIAEEARPDFVPKLGNPDVVKFYVHPSSNGQEFLVDFSWETNQ